MKRCFLCLAFLAGILISALAGETAFSVKAIPEAMLKNANSVVRLHETNFTVTGISKAKMSVRYAITILNSKAADEAEIHVFYDDDSYVYYLKFNVYDEDGKDITKTYRKLEVTDESAIPDGTMYSDNRCKVVSPVIVRYPVTFVYSYQIDLGRMEQYPPWIPLNSPNMSLESASYTLSMPKSLRVRYKEVNQVPSPEIMEMDKSIRYRWEIRNMPAIEIEPFGPPATELVPVLRIVPGQIEYKDYKGSLDTWDDFGKFQAYLNKDRDVLPEETVAKIRDLTKDCIDDRSRARTVYKYMQSRTRYVGVQVGIGGIQPMQAAFVDKKGYGDCKGLVNYTKALLKAAGVESFYTLIYSGNDENMTSSAFPCDNFNHIILCVPLNGDTTWLECTNQRQAFGFLGSSTHNRYALLITGNGGKLVRTPKYGIDENLSIRKGDITLDADGDATARIITETRGLESENVEAVMYDSPEDQKKGYYRRSRLADSRLNKLAYSLEGDMLPVGREDVDVFIPALAGKSGTRMFLPVVMPDRVQSIPLLTNERKFPVVIRESFTESDTLKMIIPKGFKVEYVPAEQKIESGFGRYSLSVNVQGNEIISIRSFALIENRFKPSDFPDLVAFLKKTVKADQTKLVFLQ